MPFNAYSIEYSVGVVERIKTFSASPDTYNPANMGYAMIYLNGVEGACGTEENRVAISSDHPLFNTVVSMAMVSKATKTKVSIGHLGVCSLRTNAWDFAVIELLDV